LQYKLEKGENEKLRRNFAIFLAFEGNGYLGMIPYKTLTREEKEKKKKIF